MKKLEIIFMILAVVTAISSIVICVLTNQPWWWQVNTILWIFVAFLKNKIIDKYENLTNK